jgi:tetratricopeptide (TPR) repeat protein
MASIIEGYSYDIFISYRQKDNKHDGWVTEFVNNLKGELESTFKEEISVYFDINPHDGLLETHDVDASLKEKLKCLIFIPIVSRTYCDPKSFAWEHEFKAFVEQTSQDQFGLKVKLPNGNVASRVLPIRIHDLDTADIKECELVLGGVLRGIEFIYTEPGVNRPLKSDDDEKINLNKTKYRNQINKVGNAIKEIISGLKTEPIELSKEKISHLAEPLEEVRKVEKMEMQEKPVKSGKWKLLSTVAVPAILIIAGILVYPKIFKRNTLERLRSSGEGIIVAVMPFQNMTGDTTKNIWQNWIQDILITSLSNNPEELNIRENESVKSLLQSKGITNYASITPSVASTISQKLDANVVICGSIIKEGTKIRINIKLIDPKTEVVFKPFQKDGTSENILPLIDTLSLMVKDFLMISKLMKEDYPDRQKILVNIASPEAYKIILNAEKAFAKGDYTTAVNMSLQAMVIDSTFADPLLTIIWAYQNQGLYEEARKWYQKANEKKNLLTRAGQIDLDVIWSFLYGNIYDNIRCLKKQQDFDDQKPMVYYDLGSTYISLFQYDNAILEFEKALEIYNKWDVKPFWAANYTKLGYTYHKTGQYKKEKKLYKKAEADFPDNPTIFFRQAVLVLSEGKTRDANEYIEKYINLRKERSASEAAIASSLASLYSEADILDKSEEYYKQALSLEPQNPVRMEKSVILTTLHRF